MTANLSRGSLGAEQMFAERALHSRNGVAAAAAALGRKCQEEMRSPNGSTYTLALKYDSRLDKDLK